MSNPDDRRYSQTHEWHKLDGDVATIGITQFAVDELTDVTFVELPEVDADLKAGEGMGEIESVKATGQIYMGGGTPLQKACGVDDEPDEEPEGGGDTRCSPKCRVIGWCAWR